MKWFILVVIMGTYSNGDQDVYLYSKPVMESLDACQTYVYEQSAVIRKDMMIEFEGRPIEKVFCMREDKLEKFLDLINKEGTEA